MQNKLSLKQILNINPIIDVVDIGANPIDGTPPYNDLLKSGNVNLIGFEPNLEALNILNEKKSNNETYFPYAVGDGTVKTFNVCYAQGMSSLYNPNFKLLEYFHGFPKWAEIIDTLQIQTKRLDDINEIENIDYLKIDIQGGELDVFKNGIQKLKNCLVIQTEVEFLPMYENQPLFSEIEIFLREQGFYFHRFDGMKSRVVKPMLINNSVYSGLSQMFWSEAIFVKDFTRFMEMNSNQLLKISLVLHDIYGSYDLVLQALVCHDKLFNTEYSTRYLNNLSH